MSVRITKSDLDYEMTKLAARLECADLTMDSLTRGAGQRLWQVQRGNQPIIHYRLRITEMYFALRFANAILKLSGRLKDR